MKRTKQTLCFSCHSYLRAAADGFIYSFLNRHENKKNIVIFSVYVEARGVLTVVLLVSYLFYSLMLYTYVYIL